MTTTALRETVTNAPSHIRAQRRDTQPTRIFVDKDRTAFLWFVIAVLAVGVAIAEPFYLIERFKKRERVVIVDPSGTFFVSPVLDFEEARELHAQQATLATVAFLERSPQGFDHPDLLRQMFLKDAADKAQKQRAGDDAEFKAKQLHQKVEVAQIDVLQTREDFVLTQVSGQIIRAGIFEEKSFTEAIPFRLAFKLVRNPDMTKNGRFPTAVRDFKYEPSR